MFFNFKKPKLKDICPNTSNWKVYKSNGFGGISAAAPHVAGAVALLYTALLTDFMQEAKQNPEQIALLVKKIIKSACPSAVCQKAFILCI